MTTIDWASLQQQAAAASTAIPIGLYDAQIVAAEYKVASTGSPMYKCQFQITSGPQQGRKVTNNFVLKADNPTALRIFFRNMAALGLDDKFFNQNPPPEQVAGALIGRTARVELGERMWQGEKQNEFKSIQAMTSTGSLQGVATPGVQPQSPQAQVAPQVVAPVVQPTIGTPASVVPTPQPISTPAPAAQIPSVPAAAVPQPASTPQVVADAPAAIPTQPVQPEAAPTPVPPESVAAQVAMKWIINAQGQPEQVPDIPEAVAPPVFTPMTPEPAQVGAPPPLPY